MDVDALRAEFEAFLRASPRWDGRVGELQVVDANPSALQVRALVSAVDAGIAFDLRCDVREHLAAYLRDAQAVGLPRVRVLNGAG